ncbi:hypothetical protein [Vibrio splendidus]|uniref:hypothetical protein n=1 Tax=Vibrio splendidus TaxID=29497 RepID=UPI000C833955|nr:hypothetical protein [Vibrio splendidus]PMJ71675.1 hypothetical protein BCU23_01970 [Vibrio splendidus]
MTYIDSDKLIGTLPINEKLQSLRTNESPTTLLTSLRDIYPTEPVVKLAQAIERLNGIDVNEMATLLAEEGFTLEVTAGALKDVYTKTSNSGIVAALMQNGAYPNTTRNEMLLATRWQGDSDNPGMALSQFESIAAVTPNYPQIQVLEYGHMNGAFLNAEPNATQNVFFYQNDRNQDWNWCLRRDAATRMYQTDDVRVVPKSDTTGRGLFSIGDKKNWYYDINLFPDTNELHQQILGLLAYSCNAQAGSFVIKSTKP